MEMTPLLALALAAANLAIILLRKWKTATLTQQLLLFLMGILGTVLYAVAALRS